MNETMIQYKQWLLNKVLIECWTTLKCSRVLGRSHALVLRDLEMFLEEEDG